MWEFAINLCFKFIVFSLPDTNIFSPENYNIFTSWVVHIIYINLVLILQAFQFRLLLWFNNCSHSSNNDLFCFN